MATEAEQAIWKWVTENLDYDGFKRMQRMFAPVESEDEE
jgi:hypothetical protein